MDNLVKILKYDKNDADSNPIIAACNEMVESADDGSSSRSKKTNPHKKKTEEDLKEEEFEDIVFDTLSMSPDEIIAELNIDLSEMDPTDSSGLLDLVKSTLGAMIPDPKDIGRFAAMRERANKAQSGYFRYILKNLNHIYSLNKPIYILSLY